MSERGGEPRDAAGDDAVRDLYDRLMGEVDLHRVLREAAETARAVTGADRATLYLVRPETGELESEVVLGNVARTIRIPLSGESLAGYCASTGRCLAVPDAYGDLSEIDPGLGFDRSWDDLNGYRTRDVACVPVCFRGEVLGVIQAINGRSGPLGEEALPPLREASRFVAYALYHARLYEELATLKRLDREKAEFMRIVVHELRAPVAAAKSLVASLRFAGVEDASVDAALGRVGTRLDELLELVQDILVLSRVKSGRPLGEIGTVDLAAETLAACEVHRDAARAKGLILEVAVPDSPVVVRVDQKGYRLIVSNLVSNAVKYTEAGSVRVALERADGQAVLSVRDTGMGIPAEDLPRLFEEFFRASNARRTRIRGTGVGLAGARQLAERYGGTLELDSEEGVGSEFRVFLPLHSS